jgi:hypothetical protein
VVGGGRWKQESDCALPSMAGARSRQLSLSKIVPDDFVEPTTPSL